MRPKAPFDIVCVGTHTRAEKCLLWLAVSCCMAAKWEWKPLHVCPLMAKLTLPEQETEKYVMLRDDRNYVSWPQTRTLGFTSVQGNYAIKQITQEFYVLSWKGLSACLGLFSSPVGMLLSAEFLLGCFLNGSRLSTESACCHISSETWTHSLRWQRYKFSSGG